jgi:IPTL-CTERM motif
MRKVRYFTIVITVLSAFLLTGVDSIAQQELVVNGSFETGDFTGWTQQDMTGFGAWSVYMGTMLNGTPLLAPPVGDFAAATNQGEPDSNILFQDIEVPDGSTTLCSAIVYYENESPNGMTAVEDTFTKGLVAATPGEVAAERVFIIGNGLSVFDGPNQQYRVDIMDPDAPPFDTGAGVLLNLFQTLPSDPDSLGYTTLNFDLTPFAGQTVRIRAAVAVTVNVLNGSIDAVSCIAQTPIPTLSEWGLIALAMALGIVGIVVYRRRLAA